MSSKFFFCLRLVILSLILFGVGVFPWLPYVTATNPAYAITLEEEQKLGDQVLREVEAHFTLIRDPLLLNYLNRIGQETLQKAGPIPYPFRFYLLKDPQLNAFSVPGGHIFVTTGILEVMDSEAELAGLLGHEIAHVTSHHIAKRMEQEKKISLATMAAVLASVFAGDPRIASAVITGSMATGISLGLKYSREDETEADNYGFKTMTREGFSPDGMIDLLTKLRKWGSFGSDIIPAYMLTHPGIDDRIAQIESLKKRYENQGPWSRGSSGRFSAVPDPDFGPIRGSPKGPESFPTDGTGAFLPGIGPLRKGMGEPPGKKPGGGHQRISRGPEPETARLLYPEGSRANLPPKK